MVVGLHNDDFGCIPIDGLVINMVFDRKSLVDSLVLLVSCGGLWWIW